MKVSRFNFIKNYFLERLLDARLFFVRENTKLIDFFDDIRKVKKILVILPLNKSEETIAMEYLPRLQQVFKKSKISTLDISTLRDSDTNWLGVPNQQYLVNIQNENFDLLLDLNGMHHRLCAYLCALTDAPLRLHLSEGKFDKIYNLQIRSKSNASLETQYENLINYFNLLRNQKAVS